MFDSRVPVRPAGMFVAALVIQTGIAVADPSPVTMPSVPPQVIPLYPEKGAPAFTVPVGSPSGGSGSGGSGGGGPVGGSGGAVLAAMMATPYGQTGYDTAIQVGNNPNALAAFGQLESGFQNVPTSNGSSSATGPWQITQGTFNDYVNRYSLPYSPSDITNPNAQAVVANYIMQDYGSQVSNAIGQPATVEQVYGAYVFGPKAGEGLANADPSASMSSYVSAQALANNNMTGWTVQQFQDRVTSKVGALSTQTVRA